MHSPDLKPCPFCGGRNLDVSQTKVHVYKGAAFYFAKIICHDCWADRHGDDLWDADQALQSAVDKWNSRTEGKEASRGSR